MDTNKQTNKQTGLQEGGRPATITCCLHGLERGQRLVVGVGGAGIKGGGGGCSFVALALDNCDDLELLVCSGGGGGAGLVDGFEASLETCERE